MGRARLRQRGMSLASGGGWTPASLTGLAAWYTAGPDWCFSDAAGTVKCTDGDPVRVWKDRSSAAANLTQAASGLRPTLRAVSGRWVVRYDGVDDNMVGTVAVATAFNVHAVVQRDATSTSGDKTFLSHANGGTDATLHLRSTSPTGLRFGLFFDDLDSTLTSITAARSQLSFTLTAAKAQTTRQDGTQKNTRTANGTYSGGSAAIHIGSYFGGENWIGDVCELIVAANQSVTLAEAYLKAAWGTP